MDTNPKIGILEASELMDVPERTLRYQCNVGILHAIRDQKGSWLIPLSSLSPIAQARYWIKCARDSKNIGHVDNLRELTEEEEENLWSFFDESSEKLKQKAYRDAEAQGNRA